MKSIKLLNFVVVKKALFLLILIMLILLIVFIEHNVMKMSYYLFSTILVVT